LNINQIPWPHLPKISPYHIRKFQKARIRLPPRPRAVSEIKSIFLGGFPRDVRLQKYLRLRARDKSEHRYHRPSQNPRLPGAPGPDLGTWETTNPNTHPFKPA